MTLQITARYLGATRVFPLVIEDKLESPGSNDVLEEAAAIAFRIPFEDHEFIDLIDIVEKNQ